MNKQSAHTVVNCAKDTLSLPVLLRSVGARETELNAVLEEERAQSVVIKFPTIVGLQSKPTEPKLCMNVGVEGLEERENVRLITDRKCPDIVGEIIQENKVILVA